MQDTLHQIQTWAGIPSPGIRITSVVITVFVLTILGLILFFRMKEADEKEKINSK